ncbi:MAG: hypothetical protein ACREI9_15425 [Nitrospiraceae bacterium]
MNPAQFKNAITNLSQAYLAMRGYAISILYANVNQAEADGRLPPLTRTTRVAGMMILQDQIDQAYAQLLPYFIQPANQLRITIKVNYQSRHPEFAYDLNFTDKRNFVAFYRGRIEGFRGNIYLWVKALNLADPNIPRVSRDPFGPNTLFGKIFGQLSRRPGF